MVAGQVEPFGGASFQLKSEGRRSYFDIPLSSSLRGWHRDWFFVKNIESFPAFTGELPMQEPKWGCLQEFREECGEGAARGDREAEEPGAEQGLK